VTLDRLLDEVVVPRPNGSPALARVAGFIAETLRGHGAVVSLESFPATPFGFRLAFGVAFALVLAQVVALLLRRPRVALWLALATAALLLAEFELLRSPISGLVTRPELNVVGDFTGRAGGPTLVLSAHYDSTTHFGDHYTWHAWGWALGPALAALVGLAALERWQRRRGAALPRAVVLAVGLAALLPYAAMVWFYALGPLLRTPSPGAIDDAGSVVALLALAGSLEGRGRDAPVSVRLVFFAAEEERALGSWEYARAHPERCGVAVVNLEGVGADGELGAVTEDGFELRRFASPPWLAGLLQDAAQDALGAPLAPMRMLPGTHTDARSLLAHGIPAVTLLGTEGGAFPRELHSWRDARERLSPAAILRGVAVLRALVARVDREPQRIPAAAGAPDACAPLQGRS
jgi:acetylornithine deacetylase/succinyl-diaminopimelate desuccinylase-like protein